MPKKGNWLVHVFAVQGSTEDETYLGALCVNGVTEKEARILALDELWDAYFDSADCRPRYFVRRLK